MARTTPAVRLSNIYRRLKKDVERKRKALREAEAELQALEQVLGGDHATTTENEQT